MMKEWNSEEEKVRKRKKQTKRQPDCFCGRMEKKEQGGGYLSTLNEPES